jgi:Protein of unknown function (DUF4038)
MTQTRVTLTPHESGDFLLRDGVPTFLLADTLWAAFSRMSMTEWRDVLRLRRRQGFNAVNISILPIAHDRSVSADAKVPFRLREDGSWDLDHLADARRMVEVALDEGIVPILVVLWCNYVPNTWGAALNPETVLDEEQTDRYVRLVVETFADLGPVFCISGDERFDDELAVARYRRTLETIRSAAPDCLTTLHSTPDAKPPADLLAHPALDYYSYQSGHDTGWEERAAELPQRYHTYPQHKPLVSMEPCYEGHGYGRGRGRHDARSVRLASWVGVLSGAGAGLGYAAHGAWSWHRASDAFTGESFSGTPFPAHLAVDLPGAWDVGLLRRIVEEHGLYDLRPRQDLLLSTTSGTRLGMSADGRRAALYLPHPFSVGVRADLSDRRLQVWDLGRGRRDDVRLRYSAGVTTFDQPDFLHDALYVLTG